MAERIRRPRTRSQVLIGGRIPCHVSFSSIGVRALTSVVDFAARDSLATLHSLRLTSIAFTQNALTDTIEVPAIEFFLHQIERDGRDLPFRIDVDSETRVWDKTHRRQVAREMIRFDKLSSAIRLSPLWYAGDCSNLRLPRARAICWN